MSRKRCCKCEWKHELKNLQEFSKASYEQLYKAAFRVVTGRKSFVSEPLPYNVKPSEYNHSFYKDTGKGATILFNADGEGRLYINDYGSPDITIQPAYLPVRVKLDPLQWKSWRVGTACKVATPLDSLSSFVKFVD